MVKSLKVPYLKNLPPGGKLSNESNKLISETTNRKSKILKTCEATKCVRVVIHTTTPGTVRVTLRRTPPVHPTHQSLRILQCRTSINGYRLEGLRIQFRSYRYLIHHYFLA